MERQKPGYSTRKWFADEAPDATSREKDQNESIRERTILSTRTPPAALRRARLLEGEATTGMAPLRDF